MPVRNKVHVLRIWPEYFKAIFLMQKKFEIRKDDRNFQVGDFLHLQEWEPTEELEGRYTGDSLMRKIGYIFKGGSFGVQEGYVILSLDQA